MRLGFQNFGFVSLKFSQFVLAAHCFELKSSPLAPFWLAMSAEAFLKFKTVPHLSSSKFKFPPMRAGRAVSVSMGVSVWLAFVIFTYLFLLGDFLGIIKLLDVKIPL